MSKYKETWKEEAIKDPEAGKLKLNSILDWLNRKRRI